MLCPVRHTQQADCCVFLCSGNKEGEKNSQLDEKSDESLWFNGLFKQTTPTEQTGARRRHFQCIHKCSIRAWAVTRSRQSRPLCSPLTAPGYTVMKCHRLTSAKVLFINVIQALWIAATTTEGPGDMWYAAGKAILCVSPRRCGFDSSRRKRDTMEAPDLQSTQDDDHSPGWKRTHPFFWVTSLLSVIFAHL